MNSKAVSPMIATILLIAFTVAVGGIISVWLTTYVRTTGSTISGVTEDEIRCSGTYPNILSVTDKAIVILNTGREEISNIVCMADGTSLNVGNVSSGNITSISWERKDNTSLVCTGKCRSVTVLGECKKGQPCWTT